MAEPVAAGDLERTVLELVAADDLVSLAQDLIRAPGQNPPGEEQATAQVLAGHARRRGLTVESADVRPGRPNLRITIPNAGTDPGLLLLGHTDVVPVGAGWQRDPFGGQVDGGRLFGRGATDMKGALAACVVAMTALHRAGVPLAGPVELAALIDEEQLGLGIMDYVADPARLAHRGCIVAEPTDLQTIIAARGASYVEIDITGRAAHAGNPADGRNAIYGAAVVVAELERWHEKLASAGHPLVGPPTWNVGVIDGGVGGSVVPDHCRISADRRLGPGEDPDVVLAEIIARIDRLDLGSRGLGARVQMPMSMPGFETAADAALVQLTDQALAEAGGPGLPLAGWTAACDGGYIARDSGMPVVVLGPGSVTEQAHRPDESVALADLLTAARTYALSALRLLV